MRTFVESLKRLYKAGRITKEKLDSFLASGKITQEEYNYILN
jgi:hypothetical protein